MKERQINAQINRMMSSRASSLLRKASAGFEPSAADRTRTRAAIARRVAVGVAAGAALSAGAKSAAAAPSLAPAALAPALVAPAATTTIAPAAVTTFAGVGFATKFVAAIAIVGTVSAGAVTVRHVTRPTVQNAQTTTQAASQNAPQTIAANPITAPVQIAAPIAMADLPAEQPTPIAAPVPIADLPQNTPNHDAPTKASANPKTSALQIGAENELLRGAQIALQCDEPTKALGLLNEHARRFPNGALSEERDAARVLALCSAGRQSEAAKMGAAFLSAHPDSPSASRVRSSCANGDANGDANSDAPTQ